MTDHDTDDLGLDLDRLRQLAHAGAPPKVRSGWPRVLLLAALAAALAFAALDSTRVPARLVGLFSDRPVTELAIQGGSWVEIKLRDDNPDNDTTAAVAEAFRSRGADVAFSGVGRLILEVPGLYRDDARRWAEQITGSGTFEIALVEETKDPEYQPKPADTRMFPGPKGLYKLGPPQLSAADIDAARVAIHPTTGEPEVIVDLTDSGRRVFTALTRANVGRKLGILVDDKVHAAPTIRTPIDKGFVSITLREMPHDAKLATAEALAAVLDGDPIAVATIDIVHVESVFPIEDSRALWAGRGLFAALIGLLAVALLAPMRRRLRFPDPEVAPLRGVAASRKAVWGRLAVTAAVMAAGVAAICLPLLGLSAQSAVSPDGGQIYFGYRPIVWPFMAGAVIAYLLARVAPPLAKHARLVGAVAGVALLGIMLVQIQRSYADFAVQFGLATSWPMLISLGVASLVLSALAAVVDRWGVGNGFVTVLGAVSALHLWGSHTFEGHQSAANLAVYALGTLAIAAVTAFLLGAIRRSRDGVSLRLIGAGAAPLAVLAALDRFATSPVTLTIAGLIAAAVIWAILTALILRPVRGSGPRVVSEPAGPRWTAIVAVVIASAAYLVGLILFARRGADMPALVSGVTIAIGTAGLLDLVADLRARWRNPELVSAGRLDDPRVADAAASALIGAGIDAHVANINVRWLLGPAGAWAPLEIRVPRHRRDDAVGIIDGQS
jgi:hypothetical protein